MEKKTASGIMLTLLLTSMLALAVNVQPARAEITTWTVDDDGPADFHTIQEAINAANPGDTILAAPGIYHENILVEKDGIALLGSGADVTIIDGRGIDNVVYAFDVTSFTIEGFTVRNSSRQGSCPGSVGVHINPSYRWGGDFIVRRNKIQGNWAGIVLWNHAWGTIIVENNIISNNDGFGLDASYPIMSGQAIIKSNTISYNGWDGYFDWAGSGSRSLVNNIIVSNRFGIHSHTNTPRYIMYNDVWNNSEGDYIQSYGWYWDITPFTPSPGTGEISADPLFVDATNHDYRLSEGSPCIDAGSNENAPSIDIEGKPRPIDGNRDDVAVVDIGAYEFPLVEMITATVHIEPDTLNLKSKGKWITAYIQLPEGYNPADIDASIVLLNGTIAPVLDPKYGFVTNSSEYLVDHNNDGILERMVKFDRAIIQSFIQDQRIAYGNIALAIVGKLFDGTALEGTETILVNYAGDANHDGKVNVFDICAVKARWGTDYPDTDFNRDSTTNTFDILILKANWNQATP